MDFIFQTLPVLGYKKKMKVMIAKIGNRIGTEYLSI